jgi:hypothetical protein
MSANREANFLPCYCAKRKHFYSPQPQNFEGIFRKALQDARRSGLPGSRLTKAFDAMRAFRVSIRGRAGVNPSP